MIPVLLRQTRAVLCASILLTAPGAAAPQPVPDALAKAQALLAEGELEAAAGRVAAALEQHPDSAQLHLRLAGVQLLRQQHARAVESFQTAIRLGANEAPAFVGLGIAYLHMGRYGPSRAALEEAVRLDPNKRADVARVLAWLDARSADSGH